MPLPPAPRPTVLLGAQRIQPTLGEVIRTLGLSGPFALVTAGWQEREAEDDELSAHLGGATTNLALYARAEEVFRSDPELSAAHRERQDLLRHVQDIYRIRLDHALDAELDVRTYACPEAIRAEMEEASVEAIRALDAWHLEHCARIRAEFETRWRPAARPSVARQRDAIAAQLEPCRALCIAGGHVALLVNRLTLFGLDALVGDRAILAWSGGAMAVTDRIVLFHDNPPQGHVAREVLDVGLGLAPGVVVFPEPERRLALDARDRVALLARRFRPARCLALPARSHVAYQDGRVVDHRDVVALGPAGEVNPLALEEATS